MRAADPRPRPARARSPCTACGFSRSALRGGCARAAVVVSALGLLPLLGGCARSEVFISALGLPPLEDARSLLVIAVSPNQPPRIEARALAEGRPTPARFTFDEGEPANVYVMTYAYPLDVLGISAGTVATGTGRPLPLAQAIFERSVGPADTGAWARVEALPAELASIALPDPLDAPCARWFKVDSHIVALPGEEPDTQVNVALPLGDGSAFVATESGRAFRVRGEGVTSIAGADLGLGPYLAGALGSSGDLWLLRAKALLRGHPDRGFEHVADFTGRARHIAWMTEASDGRVWVLTDESDLWRFDGGVGTRLSSSTESAQGIVASGDIEEIDGAMVVVPPTWFACPTLLTCPVPTAGIAPLEYWVGDEKVPGAQVDGARPIVLGKHPSFGAFLGTDAGALLHLEDGAWKQVGALPTREYFWELVPDEEVILLSVERGIFAAYHPALGICQGPAFPPGHLMHIVPLGRSTFLLTTEADFLTKQGGNRIIVLERRGAAN